MKRSYWVLLGCVAVWGILWWYLQPEGKETGAANIPIVDVAGTNLQPSQQASVSAVPAPVVQSTTKAPEPEFNKKPEEYLDWQRELVAGLIVMGDADSLMAAALILHEVFAGERGERATVQKLLARAHALVPGDRTIAATALRVCRSIRSCDASSYDRAVRNIDQHNALGPVAELLRKIETGQPGVATEALESLAALQLKLYNGDLATRIARAISSTPTTPRNAPEIVDLLRVQSELTLRVVQAIEVPSYLSVGAACQRDNWRNRFACESIARDLSQAEVIVLQRLALGIQENLSGNRGRKDSDIEQAESYLNWLGSRLTLRPPPAEQWIALLAQHQTEMAASRAWLELSGVAQPSVPNWLVRER